jgi:hypothetical protein
MCQLDEHERTHSQERKYVPYMSAPYIPVKKKKMGKLKAIAISIAEAIGSIVLIALVLAGLGALADSAADKIGKAPVILVMAGLTLAWMFAMFYSVNKEND